MSEKKVKIDLSKVVVDYDGVEIRDSIGPLSMRRLLRMYAGSFVPNGPEAGSHAVISNAVGLKIHKSNEQVFLTKEEYRVLKMALNTPLHGALVYAQVLDCANNAEELE